MDYKARVNFRGREIPVRRITALLFTAATVCAVSVLSAVLALAIPAAYASTTYSPGTPVVDSVTGGPWNSSQGEPNEGGGVGGRFPESNLLPTYTPIAPLTPGGAFTTIGGIEEPNMAVYPGAEEPKGVPYPSGVAGTPGPLDGYCSSL